MTTDKHFKPVRVQRSRKHKQVGPNLLETKYVGRPSKWGNPFKIGERSPHNYNVTLDTEHCMELYKQIIESKKEQGILEDFISELKGKNLSCWCPLDWECHADVLLELANN